MSNPQIELARTLIESTDTHLFLTGRAGTGKTTFLRQLRRELPKRMVVLAPTGIAAINAGGVTIHSFFQLPFSPYIPGARYQQPSGYKVNKQKIELIRSIDLLVIDEVSMVRADLLDAVDDSLRRLRRSHAPFGGVQMLLIGDLQQLSPVVRDEEWALLKTHYDTPYFFSSHALKSVPYATVELEKVYRQSDANFLSLLNNIREGQADAHTLAQINQRYVANYRPDKTDGYIRLVTHNYQAKQINDYELSQLSTPAFTYKAEVMGTFPEYAYPTDEELTLKCGAQVMFVKNDSEKRYFNGMIGEIVHIDDKGFAVRTNYDNEQLIEVTPEEWTNARYALDEQTKDIVELVEGTFTQYPVKLAWAITIHKSQGLTFERVMIDASRAFTHGQTYVALSRCKTLQGIVLTAPLPPSAIIADTHVQAFNREMRSHTIDSAQLEQMRQSYALHLLTELFTFEKERIAFSQVVRLIDENLAQTYPDTLAAFKQKLQDFDLHVMSVASRFHQQYEHLIAQNGGNLDALVLQDRIVRGAAYFLEQLCQLRELASSVHIDIDNAATAKRMKQALADLRGEMQLHIALLEYVQQEGFHAKQYLNERAKVMLNNGKPSPKKKEKSKAAKNEKKTEQQKYALPSEVNNPELYNRLQRWRAQRAAESGKPAYAFLQTKAMLAMANYAPANAEQMKNIPYFGSKSMERYGAELLQLISQYRHDLDDGKIEEAKPITLKHNDKESAALPGEKTQDVTLRLYKAGHSVDDIAALRTLTSHTIYAHLAKFVATGEVNILELVQPNHYARIKEYLLAHPRTPDATLTNLREALGDDISFAELRLTIEHVGW